MKDLLTNNFKKMKTNFLIIVLLTCSYSFAQDYYNKGKKFYNGDGVEKNYDSAFVYFKKAYEINGNSDGLAGLAGLYKNGLGVEKNTEKAFTYYFKAAYLGNRFSMKKVAQMYDKGEGTTKNETEAFNWYLKLADYGDAESQMIVGNRYGNGIGVKENFKKAIYYTKKAALQENILAINNLGYYYEYGKSNLKINYDYAYSLYLYACKKESELGCQNLEKFNKWVEVKKIKVKEISINKILEY